MFRSTVRRLVLVAVVGVSAMLGSSRNASACSPLNHKYGMCGICLPQGGYLIQQVTPFSEAAFDGLLPGDVVLQVNNFQVFSLIHIEGPFSIAINGPEVAFMTVSRNGFVFVVEAF